MNFDLENAGFTMKRARALGTAAPKYLSKNSTQCTPNIGGFKPIKT